MNSCNLGVSVYRLINNRMHSTELLTAYVEDLKSAMCGNFDCGSDGSNFVPPSLFNKYIYHLTGACIKVCPGYGLRVVDGDNTQSSKRCLGGLRII